MNTVCFIVFILCFSDYLGKKFNLIFAISQMYSSAYTFVFQSIEYERIGKLLHVSNKSVFRKKKCSYYLFLIYLAQDLMCKYIYCMEIVD